MTLAQIDERIGLYVEWLKYHIDQEAMWAQNRLTILRGYLQTGNMFYHYEEKDNLNFEQWLVEQGREDLI